MPFLSDAIRDGRTGTTSIKRIVLLFGAVCPGLTVLMLGVAATGVIVLFVELPPS